MQLPLERTRTKKISPLRAVLDRWIVEPWLSDFALASISVLLVAFSMVMIYSTTGVVSREKFGDPLFYVKRQLVAAAIGFVLMLACARVDIRRLEKFSPTFLFAALLLLVLTFLPGVGDSAGGAQRWVNLGIGRFQPAEFVKVFFIIFMAGFLVRHEHRLNEIADGVAKPGMLIALVAALLLLQPDFGSAVVIGVVSFCMVAIAGVRIRYIVICGLIALVSMAILVIISPYRMSRVVSFLAPMSDASGKGYQLIQSLIAIGTGQATGVGLGGSQQKLFFLPAAHTDFIYAVIGEELGFTGCAVILILFLVFLWRGLRIASRVADDIFSFSLTLGLTLVIVVPALLNIGVVTGLLPTKGMVLPLVGYGGSSLVACLVTVGLLLSLARSVRSGTLVSGRR